MWGRQKKHPICILGLAMLIKDSIRQVHLGLTRAYGGAQLQLLFDMGIACGHDLGRYSLTIDAI